MFRKQIYMTFLNYELNYNFKFKVYQTKVNALILNDKQLQVQVWMLMIKLIKTNISKVKFYGKQNQDLFPKNLNKILAPSIKILAL